MRKSLLLIAIPLVAVPVVIVACSGSSSSPSDGSDASQAGTDASTSSNDGTTATGQDSAPQQQADGATSSDSGGDSAAIGDGGIDAAVDSGIPSCVGIAYCDNFEEYLDAGGDGGVDNGGTLGPWKIAVSGKAEMKVDTVKPYSGERSLHITVPVNDPSAAATLHQAAATATTALVTGNDVFGRAMVYYANDGTNGLPQGHSWVFQASGTSTVEKGNVNMNAANGGTTYFLNYHSVANPEQSVQSTVKPVGGKWLCMQWEYNGSGATPVDEGKIWIDTVLVVDAKGQKPNWDFATPWSNFDFGFTHYQAITNSMDVYLDDFALDGKMIACPN